MYNSKKEERALAGKAIKEELVEALEKGQYEAFKIGKDSFNFPQVIIFFAPLGATLESDILNFLKSKFKGTFNMKEDGFY